MRMKIAPSLMNADLLNIGRELADLDAIADYYHVDIIDWHYVKNMCLTPQVIKVMRTVTTLPIEAHLYVDNVDEQLVDTCLDAGATMVTMPADVVGRSVNRLCTRIHKRGCKTGIFLNPSQDVRCIEPYAKMLDNVIVLSVDPGFSGQQFIEGTYERIRELRRMRKSLGATFQIAIDGDCNRERFIPLAKAGADALALGRGLFGRDLSTRKAAELTLEDITAAQCVSDPV